MEFKRNTSTLINHQHILVDLIHCETMLMDYEMLIMKLWYFENFGLFFNISTYFIDFFAEINYKLFNSYDELQISNILHTNK